MGFYFKNNSGREFLFVEKHEDTQSVAKFENKNPNHDSIIDPDQFHFFTDLDNITVDEFRYIVDDDGNGRWKNYMKVNNQANTNFVLDTAVKSFMKLLESKSIEYKRTIKVYHR